MRHTISTDILSFCSVRCRSVRCLGPCCHGVCLTKKKLPLVAVVVCMSVLSVFAGVSAPEIVSRDALFWLDASTLEQLPGGEVYEWPDVRGGEYPTATSAID